MSNHRIAKDPPRKHGSKSSSTSITLVLLLLASVQPSAAIHHMKRIPLPSLDRRQSSNTAPLLIVNQCPDDIWPGIGTQSGTSPSTNGFKLSPGETNNLTVSADWQGRVWGRTNCSFNSDGSGPTNGSPGKACGSGDCNGVLDCKVGGDVPVSIAEFTLNAGDGQTYYDISLVDGYNLPMAIVVEAGSKSSIQGLPPNLTNPNCIGTVGLLAPQHFNPYAKSSDEYLGTNSSCKLPLDSKVDESQVRDWCPWDLMLNSPQPPADGVYTYPDNSVVRPAFCPCYSRCAKDNQPQDCCTGQYNSPSACTPSDYSKAVKLICPDAYSYAFDDQTSTFIIPAGAGFQVIFCPPGRSTTILTSESGMVSQESGGQVSFGSGTSVGGGNNASNGNGGTAAAAAARKDCAGLGQGVGGTIAQALMRSSYPGMRHHRIYPRSVMEGGINLVQNEFVGAGVDFDPEEPLGGVRILDLYARSLKFRGWAREKEQALMLMKRNAANVVKAAEMGSMTWYLMLAGLFVTAGFFVML